MAGAVGAIFLISREMELTLLVGYGANCILGALSPLAFTQLLEKRRTGAGSLVALCFFMIGAAAVPLPLGMNLGTVAAVALTASGLRRMDFATAGALGAGLGAALDGALGTGGLWTLTLAVGALLGASVSKRHPLIRVLIFATGMLGAGLFTASVTLAWMAAGATGMVLSLGIPATWIAGREESAIAQSCALVEERLSLGAKALLRLYDAVGLDPEEQVTEERQHIFDKAAVKVCRRCPRYSQCWEKNSQGTYQLLRGTLSVILQRGQVQREDFPEEFSRECRHMEGLVVALNQELDSIAYRSQCRSRNEEHRLIVSKSLQQVGKLLEENARQLRVTQRIPEEAYSVRMGVAAKGRKGIRLSGDRGLCFHTEDGRLFSILCDGAGTGDGAAKESLLAVETLAQLVQGGMGPEQAMEFLNGMYILRDSGGFATLDVLELSLVTGQGTLYKWGAAPSYIKSGDLVKKVGTAAPPPGLGVGKSFGAEVIRLSLWGGDVLVLASDGVVGDRAEELIRTYTGDSVKELAALLVEQAEAMGGEDDMTVAVLKIEEIRPA